MTTQNSTAEQMDNQRLPVEFGKLAPFTHVSLEHYSCGACKDKREVLEAQDKQAREDNSITCACGWKRWLAYAYKCLYCGEFFCAPCAETHFGQSIEQWTIEKRIEKRLALQAKYQTSNPPIA
jgi:hypothetical protein